MKKLLTVTVCSVLLLALPALCLLSFGHTFNPPELINCEDIGDINYPTPPEFYWIVPEGTYVETTCGVAMVGYQLSCRYDSTLDDDIYYCEYNGVFLNRCYLIQTNGYLSNR